MDIVRIIENNDAVVLPYDGWVIVFDDPDLNKLFEGTNMIFPTEDLAKAFVTDPVATPFKVQKITTLIKHGRNI